MLEEALCLHPLQEERNPTCRWAVVAFAQPESVACLRKRVELGGDARLP
jgi:hypothetical protein